VAESLWILDGDNITHARGGGGDYAGLRARLIADVTDWAARRGMRVVLVLDGGGSDAAIGPVRVIYSGRETADSVIERLAHRSEGGPQAEVTVVSSDTVVRHVAAREHVHAMSAREFLDRISTPSEPGTDGSSKRVRYQVSDALDPATRAALERIRRSR
jgi:predicted RNA-binding protein with PIN domain